MLFIDVLQTIVLISTTRSLSVPRYEGGAGGHVPLTKHCAPYFGQL